VHFAVFILKLFKGFWEKRLKLV